MKKMLQTRRLVFQSSMTSLDLCKLNVFVKRSPLLFLSNIR